MATKKRAAKAATRKKPAARGISVTVPTAPSIRKSFLSELTTPELKALLRAANIGIPKTKSEMAARLAECEACVVTIQTEAVVLK